MAQGCGPGGHALGLAQQSELAGAAHHRPVGHRVEAIAAQLVADFGINQTRSPNRGPAIARQIADALAGQVVQTVGFV